MTLKSKSKVGTGWMKIENRRVKGIRAKTNKLQAGAGYSRLRVLGAAGLSSGFASSHFEELFEVG
jgi:hypothetical protein